MTLTGIARIADYSIAAAVKVEDGPTRNLNAPWNPSDEHAGLAEVRIHDVRHTFASRTLARGQSLSMIGELLGHNNMYATFRYGHLARDSTKASSARVAESIGAEILDRRPTNGMASA